MGCPVCKDEVSARYRPFCSRRCADIDLGKWLTGVYVLPESDPVGSEFEGAGDAAQLDKDRRDH